MNGDWLRISRHVQDALASNRPVVALESTVIAHGLPFPEKRGPEYTPEGETTKEE